MKRLFHNHLANIKFENLPSSVNVKVTHGRVRMKTIDGPPFSTFYPDNSNPYVFTSPVYMLLMIILNNLIRVMPKRKIKMICRHIRLVIRALYS